MDYGIFDISKGENILLENVHINNYLDKFFKVKNSKFVLIKNSVISNNSADILYAGGSMMNIEDTDIITIQNSIFYNNTVLTAGEAGAIINLMGGESLNTTDTQFKYNKALVLIIYKILKSGGKFYYFFWI